jgi:hypothetical protein
VRSIGRNVGSQHVPAAKEPWLERATSTGGMRGMTCLAGPMRAYPPSANISTFGSRSVASLRSSE